MRGTDITQESLFTTIQLESFVAGDHPLRPMRELVNAALKRMSALFDSIYAEGGRESIPPERLVRALLLQAFYSVRSERLLVEQVHYNLLFRWFVGLTIDDEVWDASTFSKNRDRLLDHEVIGAFFTEVVELAERNGLLSQEHFTVDATLIQAWASHKSFRPKDDAEPPAGGGRNVAVDLRGQARSNDTHASTTDPDARLYRKSNSTGAILCFQGHLLTENRNGLIVDARLSHADGHGERTTAQAMLDALPVTQRKTVGADKAYDTADFVAACRDRGVTPHVAQNITGHRGSAIDGRTTRHAGYAVSQNKRKLVEECFGWGKTIGAMRQTVFRGLQRVEQQFQLTMAACNLVRIRNLLAVAGP